MTGRPPYVVGARSAFCVLPAFAWRLRRGDCLSLTILAYAMGRAMKLHADMQEVPIAAMFDRRNQFDFLSQHVNVRFHNASRVDLPHGTSTTPSAM